MTATLTIELKVIGARELERALITTGRGSHTAARRAVNRTIGVARQRVIKSVSRATGISRRVLGGANTRRNRKTGATVKGRGYIKQVKASRRRNTGALVGLVEGVRFSALRRRSVGRLQRKPGGTGTAFRASMPSGKASLFERIGQGQRISRGASAGTKRKNLPIREIVIPIQPHAERAIRIHMRRAARSVYPEKLWEELKKRINPARTRATM